MTSSSPSYTVKWVQRENALQSSPSVKTLTFLLRHNPSGFGHQCGTLHRLHNYSIRPSVVNCDNPVITAFLNGLVRSGVLQCVQHLVPFNEVMQIYANEA